MGCGSSSPSPTDPTAAAVPRDDGGGGGGAAPANSPTDDAPRESGETSVGGGGDKYLDANNVEHDEEAEAKASYGRQRRLSHVRTGMDKETKSNNGNGSGGSGSGDGEEGADGTERAKIMKAKSNVALAAKLVEKFEDEGEPIADLLVATATRAGDEPGYRKTNQDSFSVHERFASTRGAYFAVFDGHGPNGHLISGLAKERVAATLIESDKKRALLKADPAKALSEAFRSVDGELNDGSGIDIEFSGSTAVACVLRGTTLTTAWCGDSRAVLAREVDGRMEVVALTEDHKPDNAGESERIEEAGGRVARLQDEAGECVGPHRVWLRYAWIPGLAMSRALGDALAHRVGVTSEPEICTHTLAKNDRFLILASDGIWEFITNEEAVIIAASCNSPEEAARRLVSEAHSRWVSEEDGIVDDITVVVVAFSHK